MVVNYKSINRLAELEVTPIPTLEFVFQFLGKAKWFSLLDLNQDYLQITLDEESKKYTSFVCPFGQYKYNFLPFGLTSGDLVLTHLIEKIFDDIKYKHLYTFFDKICVYSNRSFDDHKKKVKLRLRDAGLAVNSEKLTLASDSVQFLEHVFRNQSMSLHPDRIQPITDYATPKTLSSQPDFSVLQIQM